VSCDPAEIKAAAEVLADMLADRIAERLLSGNRPGWTDQSASPLGKRRHCAAVRRRVGHGEPGAAIVGRRHLLSADALAEELENVSGRATTKKPSVRQEILRELQLVRLR
jgi:hypothetical protein